MACGTGEGMLLVGDDWAEDRHDVELMDEAGRTLARARLPEGAAGMARLHAMIGEQLGEGAEAAEVRVGIETDRGLWVMALAAAGYAVFGVNPLQVARYRERQEVAGAKSDTADAHVLADMVRTDAHQLRGVADLSLFSFCRQPGLAGGQGGGPGAQDADLGADPAGAAAAPPAARFLPRRAGSVRGPGRPRRPGAAGPRQTRRRRPG
jgi:Transposase